MKKIICFLPLFLLVLNTILAQFVEEFRSNTGRRPPSSLTAQIDGFMSPDDINLNGSPDFTSLINDTLYIKDGFTNETILGWKVEEGVGAVVWAKFVSRSGNPLSITHVVYYSLDKSSTYLNIYDAQLGTIQKFSNYRFIGIADFDQGGMPEILAYDKNTRQTLILGYANADLEENETHELSKSDFRKVDYQLDLKFESEINRDIIGQKSAIASRRMFDFNNDGVAELVLFVEDADGDEVGIEVLDAQSHSILWDYTYLPEHFDEFQNDFHGFYDLNGDDEIELIIGKNKVVTLDKEVHEIDPNFLFRSVRDLNGDGYGDLIGLNQMNKTLQIWSKMETTSLDSDLRGTNDFQFMISPNPIGDQAFFSFNLLKCANVKLEIYDLNGRLIDKVLKAELLSGSQTVNWKVPGLLSDNTFILIARLTVNGIVQSKIALRKL